ncbi:type IV secretory system conjugative DNA transfer family protein [Proteus mirabilis]|nr:type IV secretory system conjugative DNA transfer family protein [Proteus mirabilis]ELB1171922.1 type IV secretory system conjugative DNA transfer family protein [Proteus mirabilis]MBI6505941.1 type IV secretory system conjugative DNA transfer family protein [Proteus mirabilis]
MNINKLLILLPVLFSSYAFSNEQDNLPTPPKLDEYLNPSSSSSDVDDVTYSMLKELAETTGFRGGKTERSIELLNAIDNYSSTLDLMYRFEPLVNAQGYIPPVIVESKDVAHITDEQMRKGTIVYEILKPARFVSNPPSWRAYLRTGLYNSAIEPLDHSILPKNSKELAVWKEGIKSGWIKGRENADDILIANFNRLTRDYNGMLRYSTLLQLNMIKPPVVSQKTLTVTGSDQRMILGDELKTIESKATLELNKGKWKPTIK